MTVQVYFNLHKRIFSVRDKRTRRVILHAPEVFLSLALFKVSQKGRARVHRDGVKNVHAFVEGDMVKNIPTLLPDGELVKYNPYLNETFVNVHGDPVRLVWGARLYLENGKPIIKVF